MVNTSKIFSDGFASKASPAHRHTTQLFVYLIPYVTIPFSLFVYQQYMVTDKSLARPTSRCILFDGGNISFDASLVIYI